MATKIDSTQVLFDEQNPAPGTPASGKVALYAKSDGALYSKDDAGTETPLGGGGGGMTSFTAAGDSGTPQTISDGNTLTIAGGTGLSSVAAATDTVTLNLDVPVTAANGGTGQTSYTTGDLLYASGASALAKLGIGTSGQVLTVSGGLPAWAASSGGSASRAELRYQVAQNTAGQAIAATTWTTITLNTETSDPDSIVSIASNQLTPIAGDYVLWAVTSAFPASGTANISLRLQNITAGTTTSRGAGARNLSTSNNHIVLMASFTANGTDAYAVQIFGSLGLTIGSAINSATVGDEIYMQIILQKVG